MKKLLILSCLSGLVLANDYTIFYPQNFIPQKCDTQDIFKVGVMSMNVECIGIENNQVKRYDKEIQMLPAPFTIRYVPGGSKDEILLDD